MTDARTAADLEAEIRDAVGDARPEFEIVGDLARRGWPVAPVLVAICGLLAGLDGAISSALGIVLVAANFALAAASLAWAARISVGLLMGVALGGYVVRLGALFAIVFAIQDASWLHMAALGLTLIVTHLGLLFWELQYVSASLAFPGLKPTGAGPATSSTSDPV